MEWTYQGDILGNRQFLNRDLHIQVLQMRVLATDLFIVGTSFRWLFINNSVSDRVKYNLILL